MARLLEKEKFQALVASAPLISMDLIVENEDGQFLLGLRQNRPAKGYWFVPGGRILKNELLDDAFFRITANELGRSFHRSQSNFIGVFEHFYSDSVFGGNISTHYVVLAYHLKVNCENLDPSPQQHSTYRWFCKTEAANDLNVHDYARIYFNTI